MIKNFFYLSFFLICFQIIADFPDLEELPKEYESCANRVLASFPFFFPTKGSYHMEAQKECDGVGLIYKGNDFSYQEIGRKQIVKNLLKKEGLRNIILAQEYLFQIKQAENPVVFSIKKHPSKNVTPGTLQTAKDLVSFVEHSNLTDTFSYGLYASMNEVGKLVLYDFGLKLSCEKSPSKKDAILSASRILPWTSEAYEFLINYQIEKDSDLIHWVVENRQDVFSVENKHYFKYLAAFVYEDLKKLCVQKGCAFWEDIKDKFLLL